MDSGTKCFCRMEVHSDITAFQTTLARWYAKEQRPLPWRTQPGLYRTVVSEFMTQQTQIKTMLPYFDRWMEAFPDFETLSSAQPGKVLKLWEGLGYYNRARNLQKLARKYQETDPKPQTRAEWQALPGVGPYISAAVSSIAFGQSVAVVDGNVVRVLARLTRDTRHFKNNAEAVKCLTPLAERLLHPETPGEHNQAMMELGATICLKHKPLCTICPVVRFCEACKKGGQDELPKIQRRATVKVEIRRAWVRRGNRLLLRQIADDSGQLAGQYELPFLDGIRVITPPEWMMTKTRSITHRRIKEHIYRADIKALNHSSLRWIEADELDTIILSGPHRRWVNEILKQEMRAEVRRL